MMLAAGEHHGPAAAADSGIDHGQVNRRAENRHRPQPGPGRRAGCHRGMPWSGR